MEADSPFCYLSREALRTIIFAKDPFCPTCGHPFWGKAEASQVCPHCVELDPFFGEGRTCAIMHGAARQLLVELKYRHGLHVLPDIFALVGMVPGFLEFLHGAILVPVPLHPRKLRWRGFNQSRRIADILAEGGNQVRVKELLCRCRPTPSQTQLPRKERQLNVQGAFALKPKVELSLDERLVIVDDVFTTGATLNACACVLKEAGFERIDVVTICHG